MNQPTIADQVWGRSLLLGHVHAFRKGACRCGAMPFGNRPSELNETESPTRPAPAAKVDSEQSAVAR